MTIPMLLLAALLSSAQAASPAPAVRALKITPLTSTPKTYVLSPDISMSAVESIKSITVWSLPKGKPLFRIEKPAGVSVGPNDAFVLKPLAFSREGRYLLASMDHRRSGADRFWTDNTVQLLLISVPEEKIVRTVMTLDGPCTTNYSIRTHCAEIRDARFSQDGRLITVDTKRYLPGFINGSGDVKWANSSSVMTLDGKKLMTEAEVQVHRNGPNGGDIVTESSSPNPKIRELGVIGQDGRELSVRSDSDTCALMDAASGKRVAFLDGCTEKDYPVLVSDWSFIYSWGDDAPEFTIWELDGSVRSKIKHEPGMVMTADGDGRYAISRSSYGAPTLWKILETKTGRVVATTTDPLFRVYAALAPDRRHLVAFGDDKVVYAAIDAGSPLTPSAPPFYAGTDADAAIGAPTVSVAAPVPAVAAPAKNFDAPPASSAKADPDAYAVIIGVEKYRAAGIPRVDYAARDAKTMYDYATAAMGFDAKNVILLTDEQATKTDFEKNLGSWLKNRVGAKSRVFVYYAGHGSPNPTTGEGYLMPYEADPNYLEDTAYPVAKLYASLAKLPTKDVTVVLDACFSGTGGRSLIAKGARPLVSVVAAKAASNTVVLAAAESSQISASNPERRHGLLTSYLLEGLSGAADSNGDGRIMSSEVYEFVRPAVERAARLQNLEQTPTMTPSLDVLKTAPGRPWIEFSAKK